VTPFPHRCIFNYPRTSSVKSRLAGNPNIGISYRVLYRLALILVRRFEWFGTNRRFGPIKWFCLRIVGRYKSIDVLADLLWRGKAGATPTFMCKCLGNFIDGYYSISILILSPLINHYCHLTARYLLNVKFSSMASMGRQLIYPLTLVQPRRLLGRDDGYIGSGPHRSNCLVGRTGLEPSCW
jgi:hypothetical protein